MAEDNAHRERVAAILRNALRDIEDGAGKSVSAAPPPFPSVLPRASQQDFR